MRAGQPIVFDEEERRGWLELLLNRKKGNGMKKKGFDPVLARAGTVQDLRRAANETKLGRNESVLMEQARHRKWKDDLDTDTLHAKVSNPKKPPALLGEGDDQSNSTSRILFLLASAVAHLPLLFAVYFHLFLLEYFWQLSAFDHGRFRTVLLHLMTTGVRLCPSSLFLFLFLFLFLCHVTSVFFVVAFRSAPHRPFRRRVEFSQRGRNHTRFSLRLAVLLCVCSPTLVLWLCAGGSGKLSLSFIASFTESVFKDNTARRATALTHTTPCTAHST